MLLELAAGWRSHLRCTSLAPTGIIVSILSHEGTAVEKRQVLISPPSVSSAFPRGLR